MLDQNTKQMIGFILFWVGVGMLFMLFMPHKFLGLLLAAAFMLGGYHMFCK